MVPKTSLARGDTRPHEAEELDYLKDPVDLETNDKRHVRFESQLQVPKPGQIEYTGLPKRGRNIIARVYWALPGLIRFAIIIFPMVAIFTIILRYIFSGRDVLGLSATSLTLVCANIGVVLLIGLVLDSLVELRRGIRLPLAQNEAIELTSLAFMWCFFVLWATTGVVLWLTFAAFDGNIAERYLLAQQFDIKISQCDALGDWLRHQTMDYCRRWTHMMELRSRKAAGMNTKTVLVTGANGYIGRAVACAFVRAGWVTYGLVRSSKSIASLAAEEILPVVGAIDDIASHSAISDALPPTLNVIVSTTENASNYAPHFNNIITLLRTLSISSLANGVHPLVIFTAGSKDYGVGPHVADDPDLTPRDEHSPLHPPPFAIPRVQNTSKLFQNSDAFAAVLVRRTNVYGRASSYYSACFRVGSWAASNKDSNQQLLIAPTQPNWICHALHIDDCAEAYVAIASAPRETVEGEVFNISSQNFETAEKILDAIVKEYGLAGGLRYVDLKDLKPDEDSSLAMPGCPGLVEQIGAKTKVEEAEEKKTEEERAGEKTSWREFPFYDLEWGDAFGGNIKALRPPSCGLMHGVQVVLPDPKRGGCEVWVGVEDSSMASYLESLMQPPILGSLPFRGLRPQEHPEVKAFDKQLMCYQRDVPPSRISLAPRALTSYTIRGGSVGFCQVSGCDVQLEFMVQDQRELLESIMVYDTSELQGYCCTLCRFGYEIPSQECMKLRQVHVQRNDFLAFPYCDLPWGAGRGIPGVGRSLERCQ
ncbi:NAD dependent epimerase/dehydratase [Fusarium bulbicola]|nr:NAD dependent epimerase/dehydratase [Fusarium bulbicola]